MNTSKFRHTGSVIAAAVLATAAAATWAATNHENDAMAIGNAKVSLTQAIAAAEQHANGKASKAEYEHTKSGWAYEVEVVSGAKVMDVKVDATQGTVISSTEDKADHDEDRDDDRDERD